MKTLNTLTLLLSLTSTLSFGLVEMTTAKTAPMKNCDTNDLLACFKSRATANHGFYMIHKDNIGNEVKTEKVALLIHGLSDSPYFYRDISRILFQEGMNVVAIRTTGHGTDKSHLAKVTKEQWYEDVSYGMELAAKYGNDVVVGGMSLGGGLAIHEALRNSNVKGLMLFSAAGKLPDNFGASCWVTKKFIGKPIQFFGGFFMNTDDYQATKEYGVGVRYQGIHNNGTCQTVKMTEDIEELAKDAVKNEEPLFSNLDIPVYNVVSEFDTAIDLDFMVGLSSQLASNKRGSSHLVFYLSPKSEKQWPLPERVRTKTVSCMNHASVLLSASSEMGYMFPKCDFNVAEEIEYFNNEQEYDFTPEINFHFAETIDDTLRAFVRESL